MCDVGTTCVGIQRAMCVYKYKYIYIYLYMWLLWMHSLFFHYAHYALFSIQTLPTYIMLRYVSIHLDSTQDDPRKKGPQIEKNLQTSGCSGGSEIEAGCMRTCILIIQKFPHLCNLYTTSKLDRHEMKWIIYPQRSLGLHLLFCDFY